MQRLSSANTRRPNRQGKRKDEFASLLAREVDCAGNWVETSRQVIKTLLNTEKRLSPKYDAQELQHQYWTESPGLTAGWIYDLVFRKVMSAASTETRQEDRLETRSTSQINGTNNSANDTVNEDEPTQISEHLEKSLDDCRPSRAVVEEAIQRWAGLDTQIVRQLVDPAYQDRSRLHSSSEKIVNWHLDFSPLIVEDNPSDSGDASAPARGRVRTRERSSSTQPSILNYNSNIDRGTPPRAPTPPSPPPPPPYTEPLIEEMVDQSAPASASKSVQPESETKPATAEKNLNMLETPNLRRRLERSDSECAVGSLTSGSESETRRRRRKRRSLSSSAETIVPLQTQRKREADEVAKEYLKSAINSEHASKKGESSKHSQSEPGRRKSQERTKSTAHSGTQKSVGFDESAKQKVKPHSSRDSVPPERRSQERSSSVRDSTGSRRSSVVVTGDGSATRRMRQTPPNPRRPASTSYLDHPVQSDPAVYFGPPQRQMTHPPPGMMGPWPLPSMQPPSGGYMSPYQDRGVASEEVKSAEAKLQKQIDDLKKNEQARKDADEVAKLKARQEAEEAAKYRAQLQAKELELEQLKKTNLELEDKARREAAEKHEQERAAIEASAKLQAKVEEVEALRESRERQEQRCVS